MRTRRRVLSEKRGVVVKPIKLTKRQLLTLVSAIDSAELNEREFAAAWTPKRGKPSKDTARIIRKTMAFIERMQAVRGLIVYHLATEAASSQNIQPAQEEKS
jgi:hypothetical protein